MISKKELEKYWAGLFSKQPEGVVKVDTVNRPSDTTYSAPISVDEIKEGLKFNFPWEEKFPEEERYEYQ